MEQEKQRPAKIVWTLLKWNFIHVWGIMLEDFPMKVDAHFRKARITLLHALSYSNAERFVWPTDKRKQSLILGEYPCVW